MRAMQRCEEEERSNLLAGERLWHSESIRLWKKNPRILKPENSGINNKHIRYNNKNNINNVERRRGAAIEGRGGEGHGLGWDGGRQHGYRDGDEVGREGEGESRKGERGETEGTGEERKKLPAGVLAEQKRWASAMAGSE